MRRARSRAAPRAAPGGPSIGARATRRNFLANCEHPPSRSEHVGYSRATGPTPVGRAPLSIVPRHTLGGADPRCREPRARAHMVARAGAARARRRRAHVPHLARRPAARRARRRAARDRGPGPDMPLDPGPLRPRDRGQRRARARPARDDRAAARRRAPVRARSAGGSRRRRSAAARRPSRHPTAPREGPLATPS